MIAVSRVSAADVGLSIAAALQALGGVAPRAVDRAAPALRTIRAAWEGSGEGSHAGRLTAGGFPIEIVCSSRDPDAVRYTCDVAGAAVPPARRLASAEHLLRQLDVDLRFPLTHLHEGGAPLRWGAWLGGRHTATADVYKLYAEAPAALPGRALSELRDALGRYAVLLESHVLGLRLVGCDLASGRLEFYFRSRSLDPDQLGRLVAFAGLGHRQKELRAVLDDLGAVPAPERLPGSSHGFSVALTGGAEADTFSYFVFARSLFGDDAMVREGLLELAERHGWRLGAYAALTASLAARHDPDMHHGLVSFAVPRAGSLGLSIGVRPPLASGLG